MLAYHRVAQPPCDPWSLAVSPANFDAQLAVMNDLGRIEPLETSLQASSVQRCVRREPVFSLTFDDGYVDNLSNAVKIMERHDAPATIFIVTGLLDQPEFWWDVYDELFFVSGATVERLADAAIALGLLTEDRRASLVAGGVEVLHDELYVALVGRPPGELAAIVREVATRCGVAAPVPAGRPVTTDELFELAAHPLVTIGVHTVSHQRLTLLAPDAARVEIVDAARRLDELLGPRQRVLAYPFGGASATTADIARAAGFAHAVTTAGRWLGLRDDPLLVPRLHPHDLDGEQFRGWLTDR